jgi:hypothetical protein
MQAILDLYAPISSLVFVNDEEKREAHRYSRSLTSMAGYSYTPNKYHYPVPLSLLSPPSIT